MKPGQSVEQRLYPEVGAGGYSRADHRMMYLVRLHSLIESSMAVLDFGAGRGKWGDDPVSLRAKLGDLRGSCRVVVGADTDPAVLENQMVHERVVLDTSGVLPFADKSFDLISCFSVLEHIENPIQIAAEFSRILKPGGWVIGWTPNKFGYVGLGAALLPDALKGAVLKILEPRREPHDSFPPVYLLNTRKALRRHFPEHHWEDFSYRYNGMPFYHGEKVAIARFWQALFVFLPPALKAYWVVLLKRRQET
jgi:SAM-dependent methyltransferase